MKRGGVIRRAGALFALVVWSGCAGKTPTAGLEVIVSTSGIQAGTDFDAIEGTVDQQTVAGTWDQIFKRSAYVPSEVTLPTTLAVRPGTSSDQDALITVTALLKGTPVVQRVVQTQIPTDRVDELVMILAADCLGKVGLCPAGESCQPATGMCGTSYVDPTKLPPYPSPWDAGPSPLDGSTEAADAALADGGGASNEGGDSTTGIGDDATTDVGGSAEASSDVVSPEAGGGVCGAYCTAIMTTCTGEASQYRDLVDCMEACSLLLAGAFGEQVGVDTVGCRTATLEMAAETGANNYVACLTAGPDSLGTCGDEHVTFCTLAINYCAAANGYTGPPVYLDFWACDSIVSQLENVTPANLVTSPNMFSPGNYTGMGVPKADTFECRFYQLVDLAMDGADQATRAANAAMYCPSVANISPNCGPGVASPPSCGSVAADGGLGTEQCGATGDSCCTSPIVTGGTYDRAESSLGNGFKPVSTTVSSLRLDTFDVTVGRFRRFVNAVLPADGGAGWLPADGAGKHSHLNGGKGLAIAGAAGAAGGYEAGWASADDGNISPTDPNLQCGKAATWTPTAAANESLPINCANWYEAYAFCVWDGGFLPSQAEWEYAAVGGSQERIYPWGSTAPGTSNHYAIYGCLYPSMSGMCNGAASVAPVGTAVAGAGLWGQLDLTGNVLQWNLDGIPYYFVPCADCFSPGYSFQVTSGGSFSGPASMVSVLQAGGGPFPTLPTDPKNTRADVFGFRCARKP